MCDDRKHLGWSAVCLVSAWLTTNAAAAATLGSGGGWQSPWESVTSGGLTLSVNATGGATLKTADGLTLGLPEIWFIFRGVGNAHSPPSGGRPGKKDGAWEELSGAKGDAGSNKQITVTGLTEGIALRRRVALAGATVTMQWQGLGVLPSQDVDNLSVQMNLNRRSPRAVMPFVAETGGGRTFRGDLCQNFPRVIGLVRLEFTSDSHTVQMIFSAEDGDGWVLSNYGDPEKSNYPTVAGIAVRSKALQELRKVNGTWCCRIVVSVQ